MTVPELGILYAATGARHRAEAIASAARCKAVMPQIPVALWTDSPSPDHRFDIIRLAPAPYYDYMDKVTGVQQTPFQRTLFLDTDTFLCGDVGNLFSLLDRFDLAAAHASNRESTRSTYLIAGVPDSFPEMNTGVLLYRKSQGTANLFADWYRLFQRDRTQFELETSQGSARGSLKPPGDQSSFRAALFRSDVRIATLPPEYNFRFGYSAFAGSEVKILHGRHRDPVGLAALINSDLKRRSYVPGLGLLRPPPNKLPADAL